jgi:hypothetical protein
VPRSSNPLFNNPSRIPYANSSVYSRTIGGDTPFMDKQMINESSIHPTLRPNMGQDALIVVKNKEIVIEKKGLKGKFSLVFKTLESKFNSGINKVESVCIKYERIGKRKCV